MKGQQYLLANRKELQVNVLTLDSKSKENISRHSVFQIAKTDNFTTDNLSHKKINSALAASRSQYRSRFFQRKETFFKSTKSTAKSHDQT